MLCWNWHWDDKDSAGRQWTYDRADLLLGRMSLGSYSRWDEEDLRRDGADVSRPIHAWVKQAAVIDGKPNDEPNGWFATAAEARAFVETEVDQMLLAAGLTRRVTSAGE